MNNDPNWLRWAKELHAIAQIGLTYTPQSPYDQQRYQRVMEIAAEIMATSGNLDAPSALELWAKGRDQGYLTPKTDVRAFVFDAQERILLVRESEDGCWAPPGGWADVNESASSVAEREVWEESGMKVEVTKLVALLDRSVQGHTPAFPFHVYKSYFLCRILEGSPDPVAGDGVTDVGFFAEDALPELSLGRILPSQIEMAYRHWRAPGLATEFD